MKVLLGAVIILGGLFMTTNSYADSSLTMASSTAPTFNPLAHSDNVKACPFAKHTGTLFTGGAKTEEEAKLNYKNFFINK